MLKHSFKLQSDFFLTTTITVVDIGEPVFVCLFGFNCLFVSHVGEYCDIQ